MFPRPEYISLRLTFACDFSDFDFHRLWAPALASACCCFELPLSRYPCTPKSSFWYPADWHIRREEGTSRPGCSSVVGGAGRLIPHFFNAACARPESGRPCCKRDRGQVARGGALQSGLGLQHMRIVKKAGTRTGTRCVNEAHTASINLQRHALDTSAYTARIAQLEGENKLLRAELGVLRDNPAPPPSSSLQSGAPSSVFSSAFASSATANAEEAREKERETVAELTLALRALSAKHLRARVPLHRHAISHRGHLADAPGRSTPQTKHTRSFPVFHPPWLTRVRAILFTDHLITFRYHYSIHPSQNLGKLSTDTEINLL
ncbi:hypothetical protein DFH08DRAFT_977009 [Mycena albidolilacea]|uniref:Uncharacterized protein n=1 Tax=Mycena albidolilacea TaxID=1033008 RepID=A0AAD6Z1Z0_9AGAR|nr:hypothetical protein DFH08DRAFT_977009 [Mycena albidolilacea]